MDLYTNKQNILVSTFSFLSYQNENFEKTERNWEWDFNKINRLKWIIIENTEKSRHYKSIKPNKPNKNIVTKLV